MFSIVIPVYNEEKLLEANLARLSRYLQGKDYEVIIANNGSTDRTLEIAGRLAGKDSRVKVVSVDKKAPGLAFRNAVKIAKGDTIISQDMDLSTDLGFIDTALGLMKDYDVVIGSKKLGRQERSFFRKLPSSVFIFLTKTLLGMDYEDYSMAAKAYKRDLVMKHLDNLDNGTSYVIELIYFAKQSNKKIIDIPVNCLDKRKSKFNIAKESIYRFKRLVRLFLIRMALIIKKS